MLTIFFVTSFVVSPIVSARVIFDSDRNRVLSEKSEATSSSNRGKSTQAKAKIQARLAALKEKHAEKLEEKAAQACEKVEAKITKRSEKLSERAQRMTTRFNTISDKVQNYYEEKLVPDGIVVENYDALIRDIENKSMLVEDALVSAGAVLDEFDCTGNNPKGILELFRDDMKAVISALKEHRTAVVNLIVAVRTKGKNIKSPGATDSAETATDSAVPATSSAEN